MTHCETCQDTGKIHFEAQPGGPHAQEAPCPDCPKVHTLVVPEDPEDDLVVLHPADCPREEGRRGQEVYVIFTCAVGWALLDGPETYFAHEGSDDEWLMGHVECLPPGRHEIEAWSHRYPSTPAGPEEWDGGLRTVDPPEEPAPV